MTRALLALVLLPALLVAAAPASAKPGAGTLTKHTMPATDARPERDFYVYVPPKLERRGARALVTYLHGCTQPAMEAAKGTRWNELADERGFVVVYPDQRVPSAPTDFNGSSARCWSPGQAEAVGRDEGELGTVAAITRHVAAEHGADPARVYVAGISGGAMMATTMAVVYPDLYRAVGHVENCGYLCGDATGTLAYRRMGALARVVPVMHVAGSADFLINPALSESSLTQWLGVNDWADNGVRDGSYPQEPTRVVHTGGVTPRPTGSTELCLEDLKHHNPCPGRALGYSVTRRHYEPARGPSVESWFIHGLSHNYPGGDADGSFTDPHAPNITPPLFDFFEANARPVPRRSCARRSRARCR